MNAQPTGPVHVDAATARRWARLAATSVQAHRAELDWLNVFPVADSDTGTNLYLTLAEARDAVARLPQAAGLGDVVRAIARGALIGARGNSGVIVSQYLGAFLRGVVAASGAAAAGGGSTVAGATSVEVSARAVVAGLRNATDAAYQAVAQPVEGTVLTIARAVSEGAQAAQDAALPGADDTLVVLEAGISRGYEALRRTPSQLPALRAAGVLDAGAWGLLVVLDALAQALGRPVSSAPCAGHEGCGTHDGATHDGATHGATDDGATSGDRRGDRVGQVEAATTASTGGVGEFEVMYLVVAEPADHPGADDAVAAALRAALSGVGQSVAVVGGDGLWQAHVHTDRPVEAIGAPSVVGAAPSQIRVRHLASQSGVHGRHRPTLGLVTVTGSPGLVPDLARAGAVVVLVPPGGTAGAELWRAVDDTGADRVLLLAAADLLPATEDAMTRMGQSDGRPARPVVDVLDRLDEIQVVVGAATLASRADAPVPELLAEVTGAVVAVRTAAVPAPAEADVSGDLHAEQMLAVALSMLAAGGSLVTVLAAEGTVPQALDRLRAALATARADVEIVVLSGGGPGGAVALGVE
ncbi:DAK2 domain-containing protein [Cellulomonas sp. KRMCY2]|uniref:DAK2 domain-containing protein n=1 Tax=Cellulomonas sp. KRMCY2 TaxID=1304865 RepID=UPI0004B2F900|nr:DAK2 domain-containing protein [Cellulomonas sp. KRMCY2]